MLRSFAHFWVTRWQLTCALFVVACALGSDALFRIPKTEDPTFPLSLFAIVAVFPGASAPDLERLVVDPLEARITTLSELKSLKSEISEGLAIVRVEFELETDSERKRNALQAELDAARRQLPSTLTRLELRQADLADVNVVEVAITARSQAGFHNAGIEARRLKRRLETIHGVRRVELSGMAHQEVLVAARPAALLARGMHLSELARAIGEDSNRGPIGILEEGHRRFNVRAAELSAIDEIREVVVRADDGAALHVRDLAEVALVEAEPRPLARFGGERAVLVTAAIQANRDLMQIKDGLLHELAEFERTLPSDLALHRGFAQWRNVEARLGGLSRDFVLAILLVLVTLLPLGLRASLVVIVAVPLSLAVGVWGLARVGVTLNQLSVVGLVISLGLLVDDSIVVVENVVRHLRNGATAREASISGTAEIMRSVIVCTGTLLLAFVPLLVLPGSSGKFIAPLPLAVVFTILGSLAVSLTITPMLTAHMLKNAGAHGNAVMRWLTAKVERLYRPPLCWSLRHPVSALVGALVCFTASLALVPRIGFSLFSKAEIPQFIVHVEAPDGATFAETDRAAQYVERVLRSRPEVASVSTTVGKSHPQVFYNVGANQERASIADVFAEVRLHREQDRQILFRKLRRAFARYPGATIRLREFSNGPPVEAPVALRLLGDSQTQLAQAAAQVEAIMSATPCVRKRCRTIRAHAAPGSRLLKGAMNR